MKTRDVWIVLGAGALALSVGAALVIGQDSSVPVVIGAGVVLVAIGVWFGRVAPAGAAIRWRRDADMTGIWLSPPVVGCAVLLGLIALAAIGDLLATAPLVVLAAVVAVLAVWIARGRRGT